MRPDSFAVGGWRAALIDFAEMRQFEDANMILAPGENLPRGALRYKSPDIMHTRCYKEADCYACECTVRDVRELVIVELLESFRKLQCENQKKDDVAEQFQTESLAKDDTIQQLRTENQTKERAIQQLQAAQLQLEADCRQQFHEKDLTIHARDATIRGLDEVLRQKETTISLNQAEIVQHLAAREEARAEIQVMDATILRLLDENNKAKNMHEQLISTKDGTIQQLRAETEQLRAELEQRRHSQNQVAQSPYPISRQPTATQNATGIRSDEPTQRSPQLVARAKAPPAFSAPEPSTPSAPARRADSIFFPQAAPIQQQSSVIKVSRTPGADIQIEIDIRCTTAILHEKIKELGLPKNQTVCLVNPDEKEMPRDCIWCGNNIGFASEIATTLEPSRVVLGRGMEALTKVSGYFLRGCSSMTELDISPLSKVKEVGLCFLDGCSSLKKLDLRPLLNLRNVGDGFLSRCSSLKELDLRPMSNVCSVGDEFLFSCSALTKLELCPNVQNVGERFPRWMLLAERARLSPAFKSIGWWERVFLTDGRLSRTFQCHLSSYLLLRNS